MTLAELRSNLESALKSGGPAALRAACGLALMDQRGMDASGAEAVLDHDQEMGLIWKRLASAGPGEAVPALATRLLALAQAQECLACGTCCRVSSPTLYAEDLACLDPGGLAVENLLTLRPGEMAYSARLGRTIILEAELIKLREGPQGGCLVLRGSRCGAYARRPLQCRHLECWSGRHAGQLEAAPRLNRREIYSADPTALALIEEFEIKLPAARFRELFERAVRAEGPEPDPQAAREALQLMELESRLRAAISSRYGYHAECLDLLLGRPSWEQAQGHGLRLEIDPMGQPALSRRGFAQK